MQWRPPDAVRDVTRRTCLGALCEAFGFPCVPRDQIPTFLFVHGA